MLIKGPKFILIFLYILFIFILLMGIIYYKTKIGQWVMICVLAIIILEMLYLFYLYPNDTMCSLSKKMWCET